MLVLWLAAGVLGRTADAPAVESTVVRGGDDAPSRRREPAPVIYLWPERKQKAERAIVAVEKAVSAKAFKPSPQVKSAIATLLGRVSDGAPSGAINAALDTAMAAIEMAESARRIDAKVRAMRRAAMAAIQAKADEEMMIGVALALVA